MTAQKKNLQSLLTPNSVAVTGATSNPEDLGSYILRNIIMAGFKGKLYPVSETVSQLYDYDTYSSLRDIKDEVDLAVLSTSADRVIDDVYDCTRANIKNVCIVTRGFAESGTSGITLQKKIAKMANEAGINVLGPNSLGLISTSKNLNATFGPTIELSDNKGKSTFISQSGAMINAFLEYIDFYSLGVGEVVGLGNKSDVNEIDIMNYYSSLREDGQPYVVGSYLENIANGREFIEMATKFTKKIPLITLIPSESPKTREYIYSHSGGVLQKDPVIDLALEQSGVIKVYTQQQLFDLFLGFSWQSIPRGNNVAVISNAGGGLILAIEQIYRKGLKVVNFSTKVKQMLTDELEWKERNAGVVDLGGEALSLSYLKALDIVLGDHDVNSAIVILSPQIMTQIEETAETIGRLAKRHGKTVIASFMGYEGVEKGIQALSKYFIPTYKSVDRAVYVLSKMYEYYTNTQKVFDTVSKFNFLKPIEKDRSVKILEMIERARIDKRVDLRLDDCMEILNFYEIDTDNIEKVVTFKQLLDFGSKRSYPIEFYCLTEDKGIKLYRKDQAKAAFESHFKKKKENDKHKFSDHVARKVFSSKRKFKLSIVKDTYYEHRSKGFSVKELKNLSFGYYFEMEANRALRGEKVKALLPLTRVRLDRQIEKSDFFRDFHFKKDERYDLLKDNLIKFIGKLAKIPHDFPQILALQLECIFKDAEVVVVNCEVKLDLVN